MRRTAWVSEAALWGKACQKERTGGTKSGGWKGRGQSRTAGSQVWPGCVVWFTHTEAIRDAPTAGQASKESQSRVLLGVSVWPLLCMELSGFGAVLDLCH